MNPLCVCFETTMSTDLGRKNLDNLSKIEQKDNNNHYLYLIEKLIIKYKLCKL